jgi:hypothetical protein
MSLTRYTVLTVMVVRDNWKRSPQSNIRSHNFKLLPDTIWLTTSKFTILFCTPLECDKHLAILFVLRSQFGVIFCCGRYKFCKMIKQHVLLTPMYQKIALHPSLRPRPSVPRNHLFSCPNNLNGRNVNFSVPNSPNFTFWMFKLTG